MDVAAPFLEAAGLTDVTEAGCGNEFIVFKATSASEGPVALRVARRKVYENANDPFVEASKLLQQEMRICHHLQGTDVPVARHYGLLERDCRVAALSAFIEADDSIVSDAEMGRVLGLLHRLPPPPGFESAAQEGLATMQVLPRRIARRWCEIKKLVPGLPDLVGNRSLNRICDGLSGLSGHKECLLHMDFRAENLRVRNDKIVAVTDWSNALIGPAAVDLYRVLELVKPGLEFLRAYRTVCPTVPLAEAEETVLRLDAAVMLALVFLSEEPDPERAAGWVDRAQELNRRLQELEEPTNTSRNG
jgi:aminoglycoside phosphotransferase (APT) family kinase protein